jgi:hypothetical protein
LARALHEEESTTNPRKVKKGTTTMQNPAISFSDLPSIDLANLDTILGGEGWGEWVGKYAGAAVGGGLGALGGTAAGTAIGGPVGGVIGGGAGGAVGGAAGYDLGGRFGRWITGGR